MPRSGELANARLLQERKIRRRTYALFGVSLVGLVVIVISMAVVSSQVKQANRRRTRACSRRSHRNSFTKPRFTRGGRSGGHRSPQARSLVGAGAPYADGRDAAAAARAGGSRTPGSQRASPEDGRRSGRQILVTAGEDGKLILWDFGKHEMLRTIAEGLEPVQDLAVSPDGQWVAAASASAITVWETDTGRIVKQLRERILGRWPSVRIADAWRSRCQAARTRLSAPTLGVRWPKAAHRITSKGRSFPRTAKCPRDQLRTSPGVGEDRRAEDQRMPRGGI